MAKPNTVYVYTIIRMLCENVTTNNKKKNLEKKQKAENNQPRCKVIYQM